MKRFAVFLILMLLISSANAQAIVGPSLEPKAPTVPTILGALRFQWPMENYKITSLYGYRDDAKIPGQTGGGDGIHSGIDMIPASGSARRVPILAVEEGEVTICYPAPGTPVPGKRGVFFKGHKVYGGCVQIRHKIGEYGGLPVYVYTFYAHMKEVWVGEKDVVKKDQILGIMGGTGQVTGPHLHFDIDYDPMMLLILSGMLNNEPPIVLTKVN